MCNEDFSINDEQEFYILGSSNLGVEISDILIKNNKKVIAFFDREKRKDFVNGIEVIDLNKIKIEKKNIPVIIAVTNREEHYKISLDLMDKGFNKIVFSTESEDPDYKRISLVYEAMLNNKILSDKMKTIDNLKSLTVFNDFFSEIQNNYVKTYIPIEMLFIMQDNKEIHIFEEKEYLPFFEYMEGVRKDIPNYYFQIENHKKTFDELRNVYRKFSFNMNFNILSINNIPLVRFCKNKFIAEDNISLFSFYASKNYSHILVKLNIDEYNSWLNINEVENLKKHLINRDDSFTYTPIQNPYFYKYPSKREECGETRLRKVIRFFSDMNISMKNLNVLDVGPNTGYFSQFFNRMGSNVTAVEYDKDNFTLMCILNDLYGCSINTINSGIESANIDEKFDVVILLSLLNHYLHEELGIKIINQVEKLSSKYLIWDSGEEKDDEIEFIFNNTSFKEYKKISSTYGRGKVRELGVFIK